jgi:hypothetical protein
MTIGYTPTVPEVTKHYANLLGMQAQRLTRVFRPPFSADQESILQDAVRVWSLGPLLLMSLWILSMC